MRILTEVDISVDDVIENASEKEKQNIFSGILKETDSVSTASADSLQLRHPKLFEGNLSQLSWTDRKDLFESVRKFTGESSSELSRIEGLL
jgi:hypothetical protein